MRERTRTLPLAPSMLVCHVPSLTRAFVQRARTHSRRACCLLLLHAFSSGPQHLEQHLRADPTGWAERPRHCTRARCHHSRAPSFSARAPTAAGHAVCCCCTPSPVGPSTWSITCAPTQQAGLSARDIAPSRHSRELVWNRGPNSPPNPTQPHTNLTRAPYVATDVRRTGPGGARRLVQPLWVCG